MFILIVQYHVKQNMLNNFNILAALKMIFKEGPVLDNIKRKMGQFTLTIMLIIYEDI